MTRSEPWALALDIGTSSTRALVFDAAGRAVPGLSTQEAQPLTVQPPGAAYFDAREMTARAARCIDGVLAMAGDGAARIACVGCCTLWHSVVGVDAGGAPLTPVLTWADRRADGAARALAARLDAGAVHARTGCAIHASYLPARLAWLGAADPDAFRPVAHWLSPGDYLYREFFGESACSVSMASGTGLLDQHTLAWDPEMLDAAGVTPERLPPLVDLAQPMRGLRPPWRERWPALADVPWVLPIGDGAASNVGSGCVRADVAAINLGTSGAIRVLEPADRFEIPPDLWCYRLDRARVLRGAAFSDGGSLALWARDTLGLGSAADVNTAVAGRPRCGHGLTVQPHWAGERSPGWRPDARGMLDGLTLATDAVDIAQALMEAVALGFAASARSLWRTAGRPREVRASGGALAAYPVWGLMLADALAMPVTVLRESEASSRGAALCALRVAGLLADEADAPAPRGTVVEPREAGVEAMAAARGRHVALYGTSPEETDTRLP